MIHTHWTCSMYCLDIHGTKHQLPFSQHDTGHCDTAHIHVCHGQFSNIHLSLDKRQPNYRQYLWEWFYQWKLVHFDNFDKSILWAWLTRCHHWFKQWFGVEQAINHYLNQKLISATHAALGTDEVYSVKERYFFFFFSKQKHICILCDIQHPQTRSKWYQIWLWNSLFHFT